ncbi:hypothetical protein ASG43_03390 [Aureimonas sp. Leaf454]|uniref:hypothetical protein n=1 Tax=Aureimonas sp. Leaf454 TaxID=1736381 RepID=UPI0006F55CAD|nr:hypothetical protein [Aureimonas sp. Leaf454]KQT54644.1 hypothetical protein ASG43_03390 [Aureimonas sp. Leaf454]
MPLIAGAARFAPKKGLTLGLGAGALGAGGEGQGPTYDPDATALFARFATQPDATRKQLISDRFVAGKAKSFWSKLDALWVHAAHAPEAGRLNWLGDIYNCIPVNNPAFTTDRGYMGDGSTSYLNTGFNPFVETAAKYSRLSGTLGVRSNTNNSSGGSLAGFHDGGKGTTINPRDAGNSVTFRVNQASASFTAGNGTSVGMFCASRNGATDAVVARDGVVIQRTAIAAEAAVANGTFRLGAITNASMRACQFAMGWIGAGFTDQEITDFYNWFEPYRSAVGVV